MQEQIAKQSNFLSNKKNTRFWLFFSVLHKNASVTWPIHAFRVTTRKTGKWCSSWERLGCFEKRKAAMFSCESCIPLRRMLYFLFLSSQNWLVGGKKGSALLNATARSHSAVMLTGGRSHPLPIPVPFIPLWDFNFGPNAAGGQTSRRTHEDEFKDRRPGRASGPPASVHKHTMGTHVTWMFDKLTTAKLWPKINLAP